jgi:hypothetical protein
MLRGGIGWGKAPAVDIVDTEKYVKGTPSGAGGMSLLGSFLSPGSSLLAAFCTALSVT